MTPSYPVITKDLSYVLDLVREYRAQAEIARHEAGADDAAFYQSAGEAIAFARVEGHIEGMLSINEICGK